MRLAILLSAVLWLLVIVAARADEKTQREQYLEQSIAAIRLSCISDLAYPEERPVCPNKRQLIRIIQKILAGTWEGFNGCKTK